MQRILVTGGAGYIGSVSIRQLLGNGYHVRVIDNLTSGGEAIVELIGRPNFEFMKADVREQDIMTSMVEGMDIVVHLAAIVGDPACAKQPDLTREINLEASKQLYALCEGAGVSRFIFASTCSNYGKMEGESNYLDEDSPLRPVSLYAETKVAVEKFLLEQPRENRCKPTILRFSTVYGLSPRVRFDLTVNQFTKEAHIDNKLVVFGEQFWRPYCHVQDLARSVTAVIEADDNQVAFDVFNVGDTSQNFQKGQIVQLIQKKIPSVRVEYVKKDEDPRDYRVSFEKIKRQLGFEITRKVPDGIEEIHYLLRNELIANPDDARYYNIPPEEVKI